MKRALAASAGRIALTVLIFVGVGPLVGGLVLIAAIALSIPDATAEGMLSMAFVMVLYGLWMSYPLGALPAALVGLVIGIRDATGGASLLFAAIVGSVAGALYVLMVGDNEFPVLLIGYFAACLVPTVVCFGLTRGLKRPSPSPAVAP